VYDEWRSLYFRISGFHITSLTSGSFLGDEMRGEQLLELDGWG
jgi:hypothetical protein